MPEALYQFICPPGVRRDGTDLDSPFFNDGVWVRFQRGKPRKMGGYRVVSQFANGPVRSVVVDQRNGQINAHFFSQWGVQRQQLSADGSGASLEDRTPLGFTVDPTLSWSHAFMYSSTGSAFTALICAATPDLLDITNDATGNIYSGDANTSGQLTQISDGNGAIHVSGGICVLQPFLFVYGSNGLIRNSNINDFSTGSGWTAGGGFYANTANVAGTKIIYGAPVRGGVSSPAGLFWAIDALVRVTFVGGTPIWNYDTLSSPTTVLSKKAIVEHDGKFLWPGLDRFLVYAGVVQELENNFNLNYFYDNLNFAHRNKVWGTKIQRFGEIWWFYPRGSNTECSDAIIYNYRENCWYDAVLQRSAGDKVQSFRFPVWAGAEDALQTTRLTTSSSGQTSAGSTTGLALPAANTPTPSGAGGTLAPNTTYFYKITALNAAGETSPGNEVFAMTPNGIPAPVLNALTLGTGGTGITANTNYFYKITAVNGSGETIGSNEQTVLTPAQLAVPTFSSAVNNSTSGSLAASTTYFYKITAINAVGETTASTELSAATTPALGAPTGAGGSTTTTGGTFSVGDYYYKVTAVNGVGETLPSAEVHLATTGGLSTPTATGTSFTINGFNGNFNPNTPYFFKVVAYNATGTTVGSNEVSITTPAAVNGPTISGITQQTDFGTLTAGQTYFYCMTTTTGSVAAAQSTKGPEFQVTIGAGGGPHRVTVSWGTIAGNTGYQLYRGTSSGVYDHSLPVTAGATSVTDDNSGMNPSSGPPNTNTTAEGNINITWNAVSGATGYRVYQGNSAGNEVGFYDAGNVTSYSNQGFGFNFTSGTVPVSNTTGGTSKNTLSWNAVTGATGYRLYRGTATNAENVWTSVGGLNFVDTGAAFTHSAAPPGADTTVQNQNVLTWTAVPGATGYKVYRGTVTNTENVFYTPGNVTTYTDTGAASTGGSPPGSNTTATGTSVGLTWSAVVGATSYKVYRGTVTNTENVFYTPGNVTSFTDTGAASSAGSPPVTNTTGTAANSIVVTWSSVVGATGYRVYRGLASGSENVFYAPGNVTTYTDTNAASTGGSPPTHNTTSNILTFAPTPAGVSPGMGVSGDPGIPVNTTVTAVGGTTVTVSDAFTSVIASGTLITFGNVSVGKNFVAGNVITGVTSGATGTVVRVTPRDLNINNVTGTFQAAETINNSQGVSAIATGITTQQLDAVYQQEYGTDKFVGQNIQALRSSFTTNNFGVACGDPFRDVPKSVDAQTRLVRIDPDMNQVGDMTIAVNGRAYPQSPMQLLQSYALAAGLTRLDSRVQARILTVKFESNVLGGFYELGQMYMVMDVGDLRSDKQTT